MLVHWIIRFGDNAEVLLQAATEAKNSSRVKMHTYVNLVCFTGESHWLRCELYMVTFILCHSDSVYDLIAHYTTVIMLQALSKQSKGNDLYFHVRGDMWLTLN